MQPRIIIGGYGRLMARARELMKDMTVPSGVGVEFLETHILLPENKAPQLEQSDLFVCGHQTALALETEYGVKALPIKITGFDLLQAIQEAVNYSRDITIINFYQNIPEIEKYGFLLNVGLKQTAFQNIEDLRTILKNLKKHRRKIVIGSSLVCEESEKLGIKSIFIYSVENIRDTLLNAIQIVSYYLKETERAETLKSIVDYTFSGILGMDQDFRVSTFNPAAEKILGINANEAIGKSVEEIIPDVKLQSENGFFQPRVNQLGKCGKKTIAFSSVPIHADGRFYGQVTVLQDVETISRVEETIRRNLHHKRFVAQYTLEDVVGKSPAIRRAIDKANIFSGSNSAVLITGETGTGKEIFAQGIHNLSERRHRPFVSINCGALTESLLDSELFGYEKGSFTGARSEGKMGLFEMAHLGTIFLDEVADISSAVQVRLLRVLQEKEVMRVGGDRLIPIDVRVIAATNRDLWELVQEGKFRRDLYYRLNVLELYIPALRGRLEDVPELFRVLLTKKARQIISKDDSALTDIISSLQNYMWPGNIRELENIVERFSTFVQNQKSNKVAYKQILHDCFTPRTETRDTAKAESWNKRTVAISEDDIKKALHESAGNKTKAAKKIGVSRMTLFRIMRRLHLTAYD